MGGMANESNPIDSANLQVVHEDRGAAASAAEEEAAGANITATGAVLNSAPEGYGTGDGTVYPED